MCEVKTTNKIRSGLVKVKTFDTSVTKTEHGDVNMRKRARPYCLTADQQLFDRISYSDQGEEIS